MGRIDIIGVDKRCYVNYKDLVFLIKNCNYKLFFSNQFYLPGGKKNLSGSIQPSLKLLMVNIDLDIAQGKKKHSKSNIYTNVNQ